jgi:prepilin-type N-terminal cleavage/methylation domain-containing protein
MIRRGRHPASGFTLIELLIVIGIIGVLAMIVFSSLTAARSKARDAARIADLQSLAQALELYYDHTGHYPITVGVVTECGSAGNWIPDGADYHWSDPYLSSQPRDPAESCGGSTQYEYTYTSDGTTYQITTTLEGSSPPGVGGSSNGTYAYNGSNFAPYVDTSPITVAFASSASSPTNESPIPLTVTFSRAVADFSQSALSVTSAFVSGFSEVVASVFDVFVTPTDNTTIVVSVSGGAVHDQNGVGNAPAQFTITYDSILPHVALSPDPLPPSVSGPFSVSANFTVGVVDFTPDKVSVVNGTVSGFSEQNGSNYSFTVTPAGHGTVTVSLPGGAVHSAAGNGNVASNIISTTY